MGWVREAGGGLVWIGGSSIHPSIGRIDRFKHALHRTNQTQRDTPATSPPSTHLDGVAEAGVAAVEEVLPRGRQVRLEEQPEHLFWFWFVLFWVVWIDWVGGFGRVRMI